MRKKFIAAFTMITLLTGSFAMTGCGSSGSNDSSDSSSDSDSKELNVMIWDSTYPDDVFDEFEEETGIHVNVSYITNTDELITKLVAGEDELDYVDVESAYVKTFVDSGLLKELNYDNIPNSKNIDGKYWGAVGDEDNVYTLPVSDNIYSLIMYNKETCPIEITSFSDLANSALKDQICMINSTISLYGTALEALGYSADSTDESQISEANDLLAEIKKNVKSFVGTSALSQLETGECSVAFGYDYPLLMMDKDNWDKYEVAVIDSGYERSNGFVGVPAGSKHQEEAEEFMNFILQPEIQAEFAQEAGQASLLKRDLMEDVMPDGYYDNPYFNMDSSIEENSWHVSINDDQISIMDKYYTLLMAGE